MNHHQQPPPTPGLTVGLLIACTFLIGCAENEMAQVQGTVRYTDGSKITGAKRIIQFMPAKDSSATLRKGATGEIDAETGAFQLMTRKPGDGVYKGKYNIAFAIEDALYDGKSLIPKKYTAAGTGDWPFPAVEVTEDIEGLVFELDKK